MTTTTRPAGLRVHHAHGIATTRTTRPDGTVQWDVQRRADGTWTPTRLAVVRDPSATPGDRYAVHGRGWDRDGAPRTLDTAPGLDAALAAAAAFVAQLGIGNWTPPGFGPAAMPPGQHRARPVTYHGSHWRLHGPGWLEADQDLCDRCGGAPSREPLVCIHILASDGWVGLHRVRRHNITPRR